MYPSFSPPRPGPSCPAAAVLAAPAQHLHAAAADSGKARPLVPRAALSPQPLHQTKVATMGSLLHHTLDHREALLPHSHSRVSSGPPTLSWAFRDGLHTIANINKGQLPFRLRQAISSWICSSGQPSLLSCAAHPSALQPDDLPRHFTSRWSSGSPAQSVPAPGPPGPASPGACGAPGP